MVLRTMSSQQLALPIGITVHRDGFLLGFADENSRQATLAKELLHINNLDMAVIAWPIMKTPPKDRGKRLRISGIPLEACYDTVEAEIKKAIPSTTEILLETVKDFPTVRTSYATFWAKEPPTLLPLYFKARKPASLTPKRRKGTRKQSILLPNLI